MTKRSVRKSPRGPTARSSSRRARRWRTVSRTVGFDFSALPEAEDVDTIGGLITAIAGRVPGRGELVAGPGEFEFEDSGR